MNEKNFDYLKNQLNSTGVEGNYDNLLIESMQSQLSEFQVVYESQLENESYSVTLHFKKSGKSDMYFFNRYFLEIKPAATGEIIAQTFYINKGNHITLQEAFNLLKGRSINKDLVSKEGKLYNAWMQLDLKQKDKNGNYLMKQYHTNYGYELSRELAKHPIKELRDEKDRTKLIKSLQEGNQQAVVFEYNGREQRHFIEANPRFKTITIYDSNMQCIQGIRMMSEKQVPAERVISYQSTSEQNNAVDDAGTLK